jgi:hypothetical protein
MRPKVLEMVRYLFGRPLRRRAMTKPAVRTSRIHLAGRRPNSERRRSDPIRVEEPSPPQRLDRSAFEDACARWDSRRYVGSCNELAAAPKTLAYASEIRKQALPRSRNVGMCLPLPTIEKLTPHPDPEPQLRLLGLSVRRTDSVSISSNRTRSAVACLALA